MNRTTLGIVALALLLIGGFTYSNAPPGANTEAFVGGCIRVGIVLGALWLALPQIMRFLATTPKWLLVAGTVGIAVCAVKPLLLAVVIPGLVLLRFLGSKLRPKAGKLPEKPQERPNADMQPPRRPRRRSQTR